MTVSRFQTVFAATLCATCSLPLGAAQPSQKKKSKVTPAQQVKLLKTFAGEFINITPGKGKFPATFEMGSKSGDRSERPVHTVTMTDNFAMAKYEVPQNLYEAVMGDDPSRWKGPRNSAEMMSWQEAVEFCKRATVLMRRASLIAVGEEIRLPSEAEWEYCCRAGTTTAYSFGGEATGKNDKANKASLLDPYGWHTGNASGNDPPVGALKPNPWGLYDMHGYLSEFVSDAWHADYKNAPKEGASWGAGKQKYVLRVARSGSWRDRFAQLRSAARIPWADHARSDAVGFRCVKAKIGK